MWKEICEFFAKIERARQEYNNAPPKPGTLSYPGVRFGTTYSSAALFRDSMNREKSIPLKEISLTSAQRQALLAQIEIYPTGPTI